MYVMPEDTSGARYGEVCQGCGGDQFKLTKWLNVMGHANLQRCIVCGLKSFDKRINPPADTYDTPAAHKAADAFHRLGSMVNKDESPEACEAARTSVRNYYHKVIAAANKLARAPLTSVYEIGAGNGDALWAAMQVGMIASGCDPNARKAELVRETIGCDVEHAFLKDATATTADLVLMFDVIEHTETPAADLFKAHQTLNPNGILVIKTFYDEWHDTLDWLTPDSVSTHAAWGRPHGYFGPPSHLHHFDAPVLIAMVRRLGFTLLDITWAESCGQITLYCQRA